MVTRNTMLMLILLLAAACCPSLGELTDDRFLIKPPEGASRPASSERHVAPASAGGINQSSETWRDALRQRDVAVKIYTPAEAGAAAINTPFPVVIFSHGIGEDRDSYEYFGRALAERGYMSVHVTHAGTDRATRERGYWKLYQATKKKESWTDRPLDVSFVLDQLVRHTDADLTRVAVAGHSAGAFTAFAVGGALLEDGELFRDPRVKAMVAMSMPRMQGVVAPGGYGKAAIPAINITGNCDSSLIYRTRPSDRRLPFEEATAENQYLVTIEGVNHNTFSNRRDRHHALVVEIVAAFLDAYLRNDEAAREWLDRGALSAKTQVAVERK